jgi:hypothetical protein
MRAPASTAIKIQAAVCASGALDCLPLGAAVRRDHPVPQAAHPGTSDTSAGGDHEPDEKAAAGLAALPSEPLDAHADTAQLADELPDDRSWAVHLDYLRALQHEGRERLARTAREELSSCWWTDSGSLDVR